MTAVPRGAGARVLARVPPWAWDVSLAGAVAVIGLLPSNHEPRWAYAAAVGAGLALLLRRRWPVLTLLLTVPALLGSLGTIAAGAALYALGRARPTVRRTWPWLLLAIAVSLAPVVRLAATTPYGPAAWGDWVVTVLVVLFVTAGPAAGGALVTTRVELLASVERARAAVERARAAEADRDAATTATARAEERNRIAREVHDIVGHYAAMIAVQASALEAGTRDPETKATAVRLRELSSDALEEMRNAVALWRRAGGDGPLAAADWVPWALQPAVVARESGVRVRVERDVDSAATVEEPVLRVLRRAVQEGVTNAVRHSPGSTVTVALSTPDGSVRVEVRNPVAGLVTRTDGNGIDGLTERAALLGGTVTAGPAGGTWVLDVSVGRDGRHAVSS